MNRWIQAVLLLLAVAGAFGLVRERRAQARLREDIARLRPDTNGAAWLERERDRLAGRDAEARDLRRDELDAARLRSQVFDLKLRLQNRELDALLTHPGAPPPPLAPGMVPIDSFVEMPPTTPATAAHDFFSAVAQADPDALARQLFLDDDARAMANTLLAALDPSVREQMGTPERLMAVYLVGLLGRVSGVQLPPMDDAPSDRTFVNARLQTTSGRINDFSLAQVQTADGWREVVPATMVYQWSRYLLPAPPPPSPAAR